MYFTSSSRLDDVTLEREFTADDISGIMWTPVAASPTEPVPLILMGQPGGIGLRQIYPRLAARARHSATHGFASATIELPGTGDRTPLPGAESARADLRRTVASGGRPSAELIDRLVLPLVDCAVPEWQRTLDELLAVPELSERAGFSGGVTAIGTRLAATEPRITAAGLFAGSYVPSATFDEARRTTVPLHMLLQWDDEGNDRQLALDLFDAFGSKEKTLQANLGGHTGVPPFAADDAMRFFTRHLVATS